MTEQTTVERADSRPVLDYAVAGVLTVIALGALARLLETQVPVWAAGTPFARIAKSIEFPIYAIALGLIGNAVLSKLALHDALSRGFRTEFFIKTGLVLLGATINLKGARHRRRPGNHPGAVADHRRVRLYLVARWAARPRRQAARAASVDRCRGDRAGLAVVLFGNFTVG